MGGAKVLGSIIVVNGKLNWNDGWLNNLLRFLF
jgi:hypothetical protein